MANGRSLGQVVGVERHARQKDNDIGKELAKQLGVTNLVTGHTKTFTPRDDELPKEHYGQNEYKEVALTAHDALAESARLASEALDLVATKDKTNQVASADVFLGDVAVLKDVPVSHLLFLENYLTEWRKKLIGVLPVLEPSRRWTEDPGRKGLWKAAPETVERTVPDKVPVVLYAHTDKHPANVQLVDKRVFVGTFETVILSGGVTADRKKKLLDNADRLIAAVKDAVQRANRTQAIEVTEGKTITDLLLAE